MRIKTKLLLITGFSFLAIIVLGIFLYFSFQSFNLTIEKNKIANQIVTDIFERNILLGEYLLYYEDRPREQWFAKNDQITTFLKSESAIFSKDSEKEIINSQLKELDETQKLFLELVEIQGESGTIAADTETIKKEREARLSAQVLVRAQETVSAINRLVEISSQDAVTAQQAVAYLLVGFVAALLLILTVILYFIWLSIVKPLVELKEAALRIASLDFSPTTTTTTTTDSNDEIGQLARAFNTMASKLKESYQKLDFSNQQLTETAEEKEDVRKRLAVTAKEKEDVRLKLVETTDKLAREEKLATIGKLTGIMGHEIRNPLGVIRNSIYFLNMKFKGSIDEKVKRHMDILETEIDSCDKIISDVLGFARTRPPSLKTEEINSVVEAVLSKATIPKTVKVETDLGGNLSKLIIDIAQIKQVFSNLILNAIEAMPKGGELRITTSQKDSFISISFKDTGVGIPKENTDKLFTPLFSTKTKGLGLGLAACQNIIVAHQGKIEFESKEGKGTTFIIKLPIAPKVDMGQKS